MKTSLRKLFHAGFVLSCLPGLVRASGVVTEPTEASLRAALAGGGTVTFACDGVIPLASTLVITNDTSLDASGRSVTLSGNDAVRVLQVQAGVNFNLIGLTVANGRTNRGAGLYNLGTTRVVNCSFERNITIAKPALPVGWGGGIYNGRTLVLLGSSFSFNQAVLTNRVWGNGGAIYSHFSMLATNCTFFHNQVGPGGSGGAIYTDGGGPEGNVNAIVNCTFAFNSLDGVAVGSLPLMIQNNIFATNLPRGGVRGSMLGVTGSNNITSDGNGGSQFSLQWEDARLGPFGNYGGPTRTLPLLVGSPAIDAGDNMAAPATDQRGRARPFGGRCDVGAFESCPPYSISGTVSGFTLASEVSVTTGSSTNSTFDHGNYSFLGLDPRMYAVAPQDTNYLFLPARRSVDVGPDQVNVNFKAYRWNALSVEGLGGGMSHLLFAGTNDVTRRLQASTNLIQWQSIQTNTLGSEQYWELWLPVGGQGSQFYRIVSP